LPFLDALSLARIASILIAIVVLLVIAMF